MASIEVMVRNFFKLFFLVTFTISKKNGAETRVKVVPF